MMLKYEFLKIRRIKGLHLVYIFPILMSLIALVEMLKRIRSSASQELIPPFSSFYFQFFVMFSPIVVVLILYSLIQVENKNKMWESSLLLPVNKGTIYLSKVLISVIFVLAYCLISYFSYVGSILLCHTFFSESIGLSYGDNMVLILFYSRIFLSFLLYAILAIPIFIYIESAITALGTFLFLIFLSLFLTQKSWYPYYPFSYHIIVFKSYRSDYDIFKDVGIWFTAFYAAVALILGKSLFNKISRKNVNN